MSMESGIIIGCLGLIISFFAMSNIMDEAFKKMKEYLIMWKHFWISIGLTSTLLLTGSMKEIAIMNEGSTGLISLMNTSVSINIIIVLSWFFYLAVFTIIYYINKMSEKKDNIKYE